MVAANQVETKTKLLMLTTRVFLVRGWRRVVTGPSLGRSQAKPSGELEQTPPE